MVVYASLELSGGALASLAGIAGVVGILLLAAALAIGWAGGIGASVGLLGAGYLGHVLVAGQPRVESLIAVSVALLLSGELGQWSLNRRVAGRYERSVHLARGFAIAMLCTLGIAVTTLALVATGLPVPAGIATQAAAIVASIALLALIATIARRKEGGGDDRIRTGE